MAFPTSSYICPHISVQCDHVQVDSPMCPLYQRDFKSYHHFAIGCSYKYHIWIYGLNQLDVGDMCTSHKEIWNALTFNSPQYFNRHGILTAFYTTSQLTVVGTIYSAIWFCHYKYVL